MNKIFDFHFHLLFKHAITKGFKIDQNIRTSGIGSLLNNLFGGPFDSQSSPLQISESNLYLGVVAILSVEHAFTKRFLHPFFLDLSSKVPVDKDLFEKIKNGETTYYAEFKKQITFHLECSDKLSVEPFKIKYLNRNNWKNKSLNEIITELSSGNFRYFAFSIEGGHNFSDVPIHKDQKSTNPELNLKEQQDRNDIDFISINLSHLSFIPEQVLSGFAQGLNGISQLAFTSEDFSPKSGIGITELGKKVIQQALLHKTKPIIVDVKHMSLYTRLHYYKIREKLIRENPTVEKLPIISSHSGFTFVLAKEYIDNKLFKSTTALNNGEQISFVQPENRKIGRTNDLINSGLYCNPWTINLFDEELTAIMESGGMIGISFDQRVLGTSNPAIDSLRDRYFEKEHIAYPEWEKLFRDGKMPTEEKLFGLTPSKPERHIMLFCLHIVHAVRVGYSSLNWLEGTSPWDRICIGTDFDGLINPINGYDDIRKFDNLRDQLKRYLPQADKYLLFYAENKALKYNSDGSIEDAFLEEAIDKFLFNNGVKFIARFLKNWEI